MLSHYASNILSRANKYAEANDSQEVYTALRSLTLADFCDLNIHKPKEFSALCSMLPTMPTDEVQKKWVGESGRNLTIRSCNTIRLFELMSLKITGKDLSEKNILDYGCGWGRLLRLMNYYAPVENVVGIDAMQTSLEHCGVAGIPNELKIVPARPESLPLDGRKFDFAYAFSVFSHTPEDVTGLVLKALRETIADDGFFVGTIRSVEWVSVRDGVWPDEMTETMRSDFHSKGYAFQTVDHNGDTLESQDYGDTIMTPQYFGHIAEQNGWRVALVDRDLTEPFQLSVALTPI